MPLLDIDPNRQVATPRDAATVVLVRDAADGPEVFCVKRHVKSGFMGGAVVFPGGKVDAADGDLAWLPYVNAPHPTTIDFAEGEHAARSLAIAACREMLEESALLPVVGSRLSHDSLLGLRASAKELGFLPALSASSLKLDLSRLIPFARWVTPTVEGRRFDARFYVAIAEAGDIGAHDAHETTASFWSRPRSLLASFEAGEIQLAPPTHRTLVLFEPCRSAEAVVATAGTVSSKPICPELISVRDGEADTAALVLPGDPAHSVAERRIEGHSRFVLRGERWVATSAPGGTPSPR